MSQIVRDFLGLRSLGVVHRTNIMPQDRMCLDHVRTGEYILSTHVESVTQFKLLNDSHSFSM